MGKNRPWARAVTRTSSGWGMQGKQQDKEGPVQLGSGWLVPGRELLGMELKSERSHHSTQARGHTWMLGWVKCGLAAG